MTGKLNNAWNSTVIKKETNRSKLHVSWTSRVKPNLTIYDELLCKNTSPLTLSDNQLPMGGKWENVEFSFTTIPIKSFPFPLPFS